MHTAELYHKVSCDILENISETLMGAHLSDDAQRTAQALALFMMYARESNDSAAKPRGGFLTF